MRVIGGSAKGAKLKAVPGDTTRPILDRVKTTLFDILRPKIQQASFLDLFGGSGGVGIEALSQGAASCIFLDTAAPAVGVIKDNLAHCKLNNKAEVKQMDAFTFLRNTAKSFDFIFVAPPQYKNLWIEAMQMIAERPHLVNAGGQIIAQIDPKEYEELSLSVFAEADKRKIGNTYLVFYNKCG
jgi:16S rRNA (guanine966-N2)-methyltransferase